MRGVTLINSGAYLPAELCAEFGELPPAFLPVGLGCLYELQAKSLYQQGDDVYLSIPSSFIVPDIDKKRLDTLNIIILKTPDGLSLGSALLYCLALIGFDDRRLSILHGDTLVQHPDLNLQNAMAIADGGDGYRWGHAEITETSDVERVSDPNELVISTTLPRLCGYFRFKNLSRFAQQLSRSEGNFYKALNLLIIEDGAKCFTPANWFDFGHVQTYFKSRRLITTERSFNSLQIEEAYVRKRSSSRPRKIEAEASWLRDIPGKLKPYCARLLSTGVDKDGFYYDSEYEFMPTLSELYVFGRLNISSWKRMIDSCSDFINQAGELAIDHATSNAFYDLTVKKTETRILELAASGNFDIEQPTKINGKAMPSLQHCFEEIVRIIEGTHSKPSIMHGDFCFSNILYSFRTSRIRLIDPRGMTDDGTFSIYGDTRYDIAKLMHSLVGRYDLIMAGHYSGQRQGLSEFELSFSENGWRSELEIFAKSVTMGGVRLSSQEIWATMISLFLSMPPLHSDRPDRQAAFIANALRLFTHLDKLQ